MCASVKKEAKAVNFLLNLQPKLIGNEQYQNYKKI
jgi:hypothetical protein